MVVVTEPRNQRENIKKYPLALTVLGMFYFPSKKQCLNELNVYTLLYLKLITNKHLLYSTGNPTHYSVAT